MPLAMSLLSVRGLKSSALVELLARERDFVVVDVRPFLQYNKGHVKSAVNIPCSPIMLRRLGKAGSIGDFLTADLRERIFSASTIVLYDEDTSDIHGPMGMGCPLRIVASSLEPHCSQLFFLQGGFRDFAFDFPSLRESARRSSCAHGMSCYQCHRSPRSAPSPRSPRSPLSPRSASSTPHARVDGKSPSPLLLGSPRHLSAACSASVQRTNPLLAELRLSDEAGPAQILPHLLLGNARHAADLDLLRARGVTAVLNVSTSCVNHFEAELTYKKVPVEDTLTADIMPWLGEACTFIDSAQLAGGRVLVHCVGGVSRSATLCIAYLMTAKSLSLRDAYEFVRKQRPTIAPNINFMGQLLQHEEELSSRKSKGSPLGSPLGFATASQDPVSLADLGNVLS